MCEMCACVRACVCEWVCECVRVSPLVLHVYTSPKKTSKQEKRKNMQQKYLRLEACSLKIHRVFLWADLGLRKKGGKKRKEKIQKRLLAKTDEKKKRMSKKEKKKEQKGQISKSSWLLMFFFVVLFFSFKKSTKAKTKGITDTDLSQEKTQDQRNLDFWTWFPFSPPAEENGCHCFLRSPCSLFSLLKTPQCSLRRHFFFFFPFQCFEGRVADECKCKRGLVKAGGKKGKVEVRRSLRFEEQDPHLSSSHVKQRKKGQIDFFFFLEKKKEVDTYGKNLGPDAQTPKCKRRPLSSERTI